MLYLQLAKLLQKINGGVTDTIDSRMLGHFKEELVRVQQCTYFFDMFEAQPGSLTVVPCVKYIDVLGALRELQTVGVKLPNFSARFYVASYAEEKLSVVNPGVEFSCIMFPFNFIELPEEAATDFPAIEDVPMDEFDDLNASQDSAAGTQPEKAALNKSTDTDLDTSDPTMASVAPSFDELEEPKPTETWDEMTQDQRDNHRIWELTQRFGSILRDAFGCNRTYELLSSNPSLLRPVFNEWNRRTNNMLKAEIAGKLTPHDSIKECVVEINTLGVLTDAFFSKEPAADSCIRDLIKSVFFADKTSVKPSIWMQGICQALKQCPEFKAALEHQIKTWKAKNKLADNYQWCEALCAGPTMDILQANHILGQVPEFRNRIDPEITENMEKAVFAFLAANLEQWAKIPPTAESEMDEFSKYIAAVGFWTPDDSELGTSARALQAQCNKVLNEQKGLHAVAYVTSLLEEDIPDEADTEGCRRYWMYNKEVLEKALGKIKNQSAATLKAKQAIQDAFKKGLVVLVALVEQDKMDTASALQENLHRLSDTLLAQEETADKEPSTHAKNMENMFRANQKV